MSNYGRFYVTATAARYYFFPESSLEKAMHLELTYHKSGWISTATLDGDHISNCEARRILADCTTKSYYDYQDKNLHGIGDSSCIGDWSPLADLAEEELDRMGGRDWLDAQMAKKAQEKCDRAAYIERMDSALPAEIRRKPVLQDMLGYPTTARWNGKWYGGKGVTVYLDGEKVYVDPLVKSQYEDGIKQYDKAIGPAVIAACTRIIQAGKPVPHWHDVQSGLEITMPGCIHCVIGPTEITIYDNGKTVAQRTPEIDADVYLLAKYGNLANDLPLPEYADEPAEAEAKEEEAPAEQTVEAQAEATEQVEQTTSDQTEQVEATASPADPLVDVRAFAARYGLKWPAVHRMIRHSTLCDYSVMEAIPGRKGYKRLCLPASMLHTLLLLFSPQEYKTDPEVAQMLQAYRARVTAVLNQHMPFDINDIAIKEVK